MSFLDRVRTVLKQFILEYEKIHKEKKGTVAGFVGNTLSYYLGGADSLQIEQTCETLKTSFNNANSPEDFVELLLNVGRTSYDAQNLKLVNRTSDLTKNLNALRNYLLLQINNEETLSSDQDNLLKQAIKTAMQNKIKELEQERIKKRSEWFERIENKDQQNNILEIKKEYYAIVRDLAYLGDDFHLLTSGQIDKIFPGLEYPSDYHKLNAELDRKNQHTLNLCIPSIFQLAYAEYYVKEELKKVLGENAKLEDFERKALKDLPSSNVQSKTITISASASSSSQIQDSTKHPTTPLRKESLSQLSIAPIQPANSMAPQLIDPRVLKQFIVEYEKKRQRKSETIGGKATNFFSELMQKDKSLKIDETCKTFKEKFASDVTPEERIKNLLQLGRTSWLAQKLKFANHKPSNYCKALNAARNYALMEILKEPLPRIDQPLNTHQELNNVINELEREREIKLLYIYNVIQNRESNENIQKAQDDYDAVLRDLAYLGKPLHLLTSGRIEQIFPGLEYASDSVQLSVDSALNQEDVHKANPNIPIIFQLLYVEIYIRNELKSKLGEEATLQRFILAAQENPDNDSELSNYIPSTTSSLTLPLESNPSTTANILKSLSNAPIPNAVVGNNNEQKSEEEYPNDFIEEFRDETQPELKTTPVTDKVVPIELLSSGEDEVVEFEAPNTDFSNSSTLQSSVSSLAQLGFNKPAQKQNKSKRKNKKSGIPSFS